ncbi:MAG: heavy metal translocating P-type ATPase [Desulfosalsimonadaceae bacterium]
MKNESPPSSQMSAKPFVWRTLLALAAVCFIGARHWLPLLPLLWAGLVFYGLCFLLYLKAFLISLTRNRRVTADLLVATVMAVSLMSGQYLSGALVAWFISMGLAVSFYMIERSRRKMQALISNREKTARVMDEGGEVREVPIEAVAENDVVVVPMGEMVPVDGEIIEGEASLDEAVITGEPYRVYKRKGGQVLSGAVNCNGQIKVRALKPGNRSFMYALAANIAESLKHKPRTEQKAEIFVQFFISGVILYALGYLFLSGFSSGDWQQAMIRMAAITAVACPCAWALAVSTAFAAALSGLGRKGVLARGGIPLEQAGLARHVVLDKTGTLTLTRPKVAQVLTMDIDPDRMLALAAAVERGFHHPIAMEIVDYARTKNAQKLNASGYAYLPGLGVKARVDHTEVVLGSAETLDSLGVILPGEVSINGRSIWVAADKEAVGVIGIADELRKSAEGIGRRFKAMGISSVCLATGDREAGEARRVAQKIGADNWQWAMGPEEKTALVTRLANTGGVIMIGDGVNDAAGLLSPWTAALLHHVSSVFVVANSARLALR